MDSSPLFIKRMDAQVLLLTAFYTASLAISVFITFFSYRAYERTRSSSLRSLTIGFGIISIGFVFGGGLDWFTGLDFKSVMTTQSVFTTTGLGFLMYSLFVDDPYTND